MHSLCMQKKWLEERKFTKGIFESSSSPTIGLERRICLDNFVGSDYSIGLGSLTDDPYAMEKVKLFFENFSTLPSWFTNLWILVKKQKNFLKGIKITQIFRNGGLKK